MKFKLLVNAKLVQLQIVFCAKMETSAHVIFVEMASSIKMMEKFVLNVQFKTASVVTKRTQVNVLLALMALSGLAVQNNVMSQVIALIHNISMDNSVFAHR